MNNLFDDTEQIRASWFKPGEFVIIQSEMYAEDDIFIKNKLMSSESGSQDKDKKTVFNYNLGDVQCLTIQRMVKGWNLYRLRKQPDGSTQPIPIPFALENVPKLPKPYYDYIYQEINNRNPDMSKQEAQTFLPPSSNVIEANQTTQEP
jgi:hypothetical protein